MKIRAKIKEVVLANKMIREMQQYGLSAEDMLRVIKLSRKQFKELQNEK